MYGVELGDKIACPMVDRLRIRRRPAASQAQALYEYIFVFVPVSSPSDYTINHYPLDQETSSTKMGVELVAADSLALKILRVTPLIATTIL